MSFYDSPEWKQSIAMRPSCNKVLCQTFNVTEDNIIRFDRDENGLHVLDREFHIDLKVILPNGSQVTGQEKALSYEFYKFKTFTIEFYQNHNTQEKGEFFHIAAQFYLHGYGNKDNTDFAEWHIIRIMDLLNWLKDKPIDEFNSRLRCAGGSRASFFWLKYSEIPDKFIFASSS